MNKQIFKDLGFTEGEIKIYFSLLDLGESTSGPLIKKSGISGSKVYEILEKLIKKGLVSYVVKGKVKYFRVASASRLLEYVEKKEQELTEQKKEVQEILPELEKKLIGKEIKRDSFVLEGYGGIKTFFKMILDELEKGEEYYVITLGEDLIDENVVLFLEQHHNKREEKGIGIKLLMNPGDKKFVRNYNYKKMQIRFVKDFLPVGTFIFKDYVANVKFGEGGVVFVMKDEKIAKSYREFFNGLWDKAKK